MKKGIKNLRVGMVGLGEVAQTIHFPVLDSMIDYFTVTAVCDISDQLLGKYSQRENIQLITKDYKELVSSELVDVVFILNSDEYHGAVASDAMLAGKDVMVEKPLVLTISEAEKLKAIQEKTDKLLFVGYMRRFASSFLELKRDLVDLGKPYYVKLRDILGPNQYFVKQGHDVLYPTDISDESSAEKINLGIELVNEAIGREMPDQLKKSYRLLCGLGVHDLSLAREIFGMPQSIESAEIWLDGRFVRATLNYGDFKIGYETGIDENGRFDAQLEIIAERGIGKVIYDTPYLRSLPVLYEKKLTDGEKHSVIQTRTTFRDPYSQEILELHRCLVEREDPKTNIDDSIEDLRIFKAIVESAYKGCEITIYNN